MCGQNYDEETNKGFEYTRYRNDDVNHEQSDWQASMHSLTSRYDISMKNGKLTFLCRHSAL